MGWQKIHDGGYVCSETGNYVYTSPGGGPPSTPCEAPTPAPVPGGQDSNATVFTLYDQNGNVINVTGAMLAASGFQWPPTGSINIEGLIQTFIERAASRGTVLSSTPPDGVGGEDPLTELPPWLQPGGLGGGGGGGGGFTAKYNQPDDGDVNDLVKSLLVSMVGTFDEGRQAMLREVYLEADRANFDSDTQTISPVQAVKEKIRSFGDYERIHKLRPDELDDMEWVTSRQGALVNLGIAEDQAIDLGVTAATAGLNTEDTQTLGAVAETQRTGQVGSGLREKMTNAARAGMQLLR